MTRDAAAGELPREDAGEARETALDELASVAANRGMRIAVRMLGRADAEDAVQEALAKTCRDFAHVERPANAEELLGRADDAATLRRHVDRLPTMQRTAIILRYAEELPVAEVATTMGIAETTAKKHLARGLARLRDEIGRAS